MKFFLTVMLAICTAFIAACGNDSATDSEQAVQQAESMVSAANSPAAAQTPEVTFNVTGAVNVEVAGNISIFCGNDGGTRAPSIEVGYITTRTMLSLNLLPGASGTVTLKGRHDEGAQPGRANFVHFRSEDVKNFNTASGELVIESMPTAQGERFIGTLMAEMKDKQGNVIKISAVYDADAGSQSFDDC